MVRTLARTCFDASVSTNSTGILWAQQFYVDPVINLPFDHTFLDQFPKVVFAFSLIPFGHLGGSIVKDEVFQEVLGISSSPGQHTNQDIRYEYTYRTYGIDRF